MIRRESEHTVGASPSSGVIKIANNRFIDAFVPRIQRDNAVHICARKRERDACLIAFPIVRDNNVDFVCCIIGTYVYVLI